EPQRDLDVHRRLGAAAPAAEHLQLRARLRHRQPHARLTRAAGSALGGLGALLPARLARLRARLGGLAAVAGAVGGRLDLALAASVVGRVEAGALEEDGHRPEDARQRSLPTHLARRRRWVVHAVENLELVSVRTAV